MASSDAGTPYAGSSIHPRKDKRSTCRHFREGKCVFWQTPEHAPRRPLPVETSPPAPPTDGPPPLHLEEAPPYVRALIPANHHPTDSLAARPLAQVPATGPNSDDGRHACHGDSPQYLGYYLNNAAPDGRADFQPYHPPTYAPGSSPNSPVRPSLSTSFAPHLSDGYIAPPFVEQEGNPLVNPEKLRRERSKMCWYGEDCKRPSCYYRHGVTEDDAEVEPSGPASAASSATAVDFSNAGSEKGKEKWNAGGQKGLESSSDQGFSAEVKMAAEDKITAGDEAFEEQPSDNREHNAFRRAPLVVNGTNYRRRAGMGRLFRDYTHGEVF
ncbi:hypothetical protein ColTof3_14058 [Colletotrichum tofieldiae]|nr:hypothetical protein ColTof3_14058 [Colletotrichum tofieldiae]